MKVIAKFQITFKIEKVFVGNFNIIDFIKRKNLEQHFFNNLKK